MRLVAPPGYQSLVLFDKIRHKHSGVRAPNAGFAAALHSIYLNVVEFIAASRHFPIVFGHDPEGRLQPLALTGLEPGQNLFIDNDGNWLADHYCPAYIRRYPFCTVQLPDARAAVCVDEIGLNEGAVALFDADGDESARWKSYQALLQEFETARAQTALLTQVLEQCRILEEFEADLNPFDAPRKRVTGMLRVNEDKLKNLPSARIAELMQTGLLSRIYAHLMSLDHFNRLLDLYVARVAVR